VSRIARRKKPRRAPGGRIGTARKKALDGDPIQGRKTGSRVFASSQEVHQEGKAAAGRMASRLLAHGAGSSRRVTGFMQITIPIGLSIRMGDLE